LAPLANAAEFQRHAIKSSKYEVWQCTLEVVSGHLSTVGEFNRRSQRHTAAVLERTTNAEKQIIESLNNQHLAELQSIQIAPHNQNLQLQNTFAAWAQTQQKMAATRSSLALPQVRNTN
jgi:hypothetical protein